MWTWTAIDATSKLIVSWLVGSRDAGAAYTFMQDVASRIVTRSQFTTDGRRVYLNAVEDAFGADVDYATLVKIYGNVRRTKRATARRRSSAARCTSCTTTSAARIRHFA